MKTSLLLVPVLCLSVTACASDEKKPVRLCPQVAILRPLERVEDHGSETIDPSTLVSVAVMQSVEGNCSYSDKGVDINFTLAMQAEKGPRLGGNKISFPYSITLVSPEEKILAKEMITAEFVFGADSKQAQTKQPLHVFLPLAKDQDASAYRVLTGYQLTESQLNALHQKETSAP